MLTSYFKIYKCFIFLYKIKEISLSSVQGRRVIAYISARQKAYSLYFCSSYLFQRVFHVFFCGVFEMFPHVDTAVDL